MRRAVLSRPPSPRFRTISHRHREPPAIGRRSSSPRPYGPWPTPCVRFRRSGGRPKHLAPSPFRYSRRTTASKPTPTATAIVLNPIESLPYLLVIGERTKQYASRSAFTVVTETVDLFLGL